MKFQKVLLGHVYVGTNLSSCQFRSLKAKPRAIIIYFVFLWEINKKGQK